MLKTYNIMDEYSIRENPAHYDDASLSDEYQDEVYKFAKDLLTKNKFNNVIDIGCGSGFKLIKYFDENNTIGIETEPCLSKLKNKYINKKWVESGKIEESFPNFIEDTDLIICADVIEHIKDPDKLIEYINRFNYKYLIISTPDRKFLNWKGPPGNPCHVREWAFEEFKKYLNLNFSYTEGYHCEKQKECMFFVCKK